MLNLKCASPDRWFQQVLPHLDELIIDHGHCEKKAAGTAMNLLFACVDNPEFAKAMTEIVNEELDHFNQVLQICQQREIRFRRLRPSRYGQRLHELVRKQEPGRAVDRLLVAGLIEARSCERFGLLQTHLDDRVLADFYGSLFESEARHHSTYTRFARSFASEADVQARLEELAEQEATIIIEGDDLPRMHS